jgi:TM2 domain-containing membrane protein YozV
MPLIRLTCPTCARLLEIGDETIGKEVECGACHQVFIVGEYEEVREKRPPGLNNLAPGSVEDLGRRNCRRRPDHQRQMDARRGYAVEQKSRLAYILLGVFLGFLGIHNFYAGRTGPGMAQLLITVISIPLIFVCIGMVTMWIPFVWAIVEVMVVDEDANRVPMAT